MARTPEFNDLPRHRSTLPLLLHGQPDAGGFVQGFLEFAFGIGVRDDAGADLIDELGFLRGPACGWRC